MRRGWGRPGVLAVALAATLVVGLGACAHTSFDGRRFSKEATSYRVGTLPGDWQRVDVDQQDLAFHKPGQGTISAHALCEQYDDVPHGVLLNHLLFGFTQREYVIEQDVVLDGRTSRHAVIDAELDGVPVRLEVFILTRNGCVFDLSYVSTRAAPAHASFHAFVRDFAIERAGRE